MRELPPRPAKRRTSFAKLFEGIAIWAIVAAVVGWLAYKEFSQRTVNIEQAKAGRMIMIETENLHGITDKSVLVCQGLTLGKVTRIEARPNPNKSGTLAITIHAQLDALYSGWKFGNEATVESAGVMRGWTGPLVILKFTGMGTEGEAKAGFPNAETQRITLQAPEDTETRIKALLTEMEVIAGAFSREVPPPEGWPAEKKATRIDVLVSNLSAASEAINAAAKKLDHQMDAESDESLMAGMRDMQKELKCFTKNSNQLIDDVRKSVTSIEGRFDETFGANKVERARLRKEAEEVLSSLDTFVDRLDDLASRTGDTFLGRTFIRKPGDKVENENDEGPSGSALDRRAGPRR